MSRLVNSEDTGAKTDTKKKLNKRQKQQQIVAAVIAIILAGSMVLTLVPAFLGR